MNKLLTYFFLSALSFSSYAQNWQALGINLNSDIKVLYTDTVDNLLYLGGNFYLNSGIGDDTLRGIATWNGATFSRLGKGIDYFNITSVAGPVYTIVRFQNEIYVGGSITMAGDQWVNGITKWNGISWDTISQGVTDIWNNRGLINDMKVINNELYIAGAFDSVGVNNIGANSLAKFDGVQWSTVHNFPKWDYHTNSQNIIEVITEYNGEIYVAGRFSDSAPIDTMYNICKWNGISWEQLGNGIGGGTSWVKDMEVYNGKLYVAGSFNKTDNSNNPGNRIACWNGSSWEQVGDFWGTTPPSFAVIEDIEVYNNELWVAGLFQYTGSMNSPFLAKYDGNTWCTVGDTIDFRTGAIAVYNNDLYLGGSFTKINSDTINQLAKWIGGNFTDSCEVFVSVDHNNVLNKDINIYPNPNNGFFTFLINGLDFSTATIKIYNISGQLILNKNLTQNLTKIDLTKFSKGIYFVKMENDNEVVMKKIIYQ